MNANGVSYKIALHVLLAGAAPLWAVNAKSLVKQGNQAYAQGDYLEAVAQYDQALADAPKAVVPLFNKANSYYRMDDLDEAIALYRNVDLKARDMSLVAKARYNLGNCAFEQGLKQRDSDLQKAVDLMKDGISHWQRTLKVNPDDPRTGRNIEVARLTIKDIMDQIKQQQDQQKNDPNQPQDPNQQQSESSDQQEPQDPQDQSQDPNQPQDSQDPQDPNEGESKDEQEQQSQEDKDPEEDSKDPPPQPDQAQEDKDKVKQDMTAQAILDKEQRQNDERKKRQRSSHERVDRDW